MIKFVKRRIVKSDSVFVIAGDDKGKVGKVIKIVGGESSLMVVVSGVNIKKVIKKDSSGSKVISTEHPINISNVMYYDTSTETVGRVGFRFVEGKKVKFCKSSRRVVV